MINAIWSWKQLHSEHSQGLARPGYLYGKQVNWTLAPVSKVFTKKIYLHVNRLEQNDIDGETDLPLCKCIQMKGRLPLLTFRRTERRGILANGPFSFVTLVCCSFPRNISWDIILLSKMPQPFHFSTRASLATCKNKGRYLPLTQIASIRLMRHLSIIT